MFKVLLWRMDRNSEGVGWVVGTMRGWVVETMRGWVGLLKL